MAIYVGLAVVSAATLMYEIALTRLLSVVAWYYLAFVSISTAMLGMTVGALAVHLRPTRFEGDLVLLLRRAAVGMGASLPACLVTLLALPVEMAPALQTFFSFLLFCTVVSIPFVFSGVFICLALTRAPHPMGRLYAADLGGAALGTLCAVLLLQAVDAPSAILMVSALPLAGAAWLTKSGPARARTLGAALLAVAAGGLNSATAHGIQPIWSKGHLDERTGILVERWNAISRVRAYAPSKGAPPLWGASPLAPPQHPEAAYAGIDIDNDAGTFAVRYRGDPAELAFLSYDVTSVGAAFRGGGGDAVIIGVGGGRDVLMVHAAGYERIVGLEVNGAILRTVTGELRDFARLHTVPGVELHEAEGRSWLQRNDRRFDLIQASMVDTWAATAAGAMSLTENGLYTVEAWRLFLDRLKPGGIVCFSRWLNTLFPHETPRLASVAVAALLEAGVAAPDRHVAILTSSGVATMIVSRDPLSAEDMARLDHVAVARQYVWVAGPGRASAHEPLRRVLAARSVAELEGIDDGLVTYAPTRDRSPFFFNAIRLSRLRAALGSPLMVGNARATLVLICFLAAAATLAAVSIVWPAWRAGGAGHGLASGLHVLLVGVGFMLVEMAAMMQMSLVVGHPAYALVVVLGTLLVVSGAGSLLAERLPARRPWAMLPTALAGVGAFAYLALAESLVSRASGWLLAGRIGACVAVLVPLGLLMGGCLPMALRGVRAAGREASVAWLWAVNGAASVVATFVAILLAMETSIPTTVAVGAASYLLAAPLVPAPRS
jgi:SAM-dependent methyltransferase